MADAEQSDVDMILGAVEWAVDELESEKSSDYEKHAESIRQVMDFVASLPAEILATWKPNLPTLEEAAKILSDAKHNEYDDYEVECNEGVECVRWRGGWYGYSDFDARIIAAGIARKNKAKETDD